MAPFDLDARLAWIEKTVKEQDRKIESLKLRIEQLEQQLMALRQAPNA